MPNNLVLGPLLSLLLWAQLSVVRELPVCTWQRNGVRVVWASRVWECDATTGQWLKQTR